MCTHPKWSNIKRDIVNKGYYKECITVLIQYCLACNIAREVKDYIPDITENPASQNRIIMESYYRSGYWCASCGGQVTHDGTILACRNVLCTMAR